LGVSNRLDTSLIVKRLRSSGHEAQIQPIAVSLDQALCRQVYHRVHILRVEEAKQLITSEATLLRESSQIELRQHFQVITWTQKSMRPSGERIRQRARSRCQN
jgi:hypothetical protein